MKTQARLSMIFVALALAGAAQAGNLLDVQLIERPSNRPLTSYWYEGNAWVAGRAGREFRVRMHNHSGERVLAVLSVDGVNAVNGLTAGFNQPGYVLEPYQTLDIDGWRKASDRTAAFYFTSIPDSYAARTDRPDNVGVVGVAVFQEARAYPQWSESRRYEQDAQSIGGAHDKRANAPAPNAPAPAAESAARAPTRESSTQAKSHDQYGAAPSLGTGHGRQEYAPSVRVQFDREGSPAEVVSVRYDSRDNLLAMGIIPSGYPRYQQPDAFPREGGFVPDPAPVWRGGWGSR